MNINRSKCILEIVRGNQTGPTIRTMEAIYAQKKLITNNEYIVNEPFYTPNNIFIINESNLEEITHFMEQPFVPYDNSWMEKYDVKSWVENFINS